MRYILLYLFAELYVKTRIVELYISIRSAAAKFENFYMYTTAINYFGKSKSARFSHIFFVMAKFEKGLKSRSDLPSRFSPVLSSSGFIIFRFSNLQVLQVS